MQKPEKNKESLALIKVLKQSLISIEVQFVKNFPIILSKKVVGTLCSKVMLCSNKNIKPDSCVSELKSSKEMLEVVGMNYKHSEIANLGDLIEAEKQKSIEIDNYNATRCYESISKLSCNDVFPENDVVNGEDIDYKKFISNVSLKSEHCESLYR